MNRPGRYRGAGALLKRVIIVTLLVALVGVAFIAAYPDYVYAGGNVFITRQLFSPSINTNATGGDNNGFESTPNNAHADGGGSALETDSIAKKNEIPTDTGRDKNKNNN